MAAKVSPRISIVGFDLSDNATGRAELLAQLLAPRYDVTVVGTRSGPDVWFPALRSAIEYRSIPAARYPRFIGTLSSLVELIDGDVILASKPRPTSFGLALLARARRRRPVILDIDDWELGFFYRAGFWGRVGRGLNLANPNGLTWTWLMERCVGAADAVTVASRFLERRFGGTLLPHVRDTDAWAPAKHDRESARRDLGVEQERVVMFLGTPRGHKGVDDLVDAIGGIRGGVVLAFVGVDLTSARARSWQKLPFVRLVGRVSFEDVPRFLVAADVVVIPQRDTADTIGQVPAKLFDAMALARPIVSTAVSMIPEILDGCGVVVPPGDVTALRAAIERLLADRAAAEQMGREARARCEAHYSFRTARATLFPLVERVLANDPRTRSRR